MIDLGAWANEEYCVRGGEGPPGGDKPEPQD
jgi:endogenous inhibitor of DNA gyrase (YacG/DUF329 family)